MSENSNLPLFVPANNGEITLTYPQGADIDASLVKYGQLLTSNKVTPWLDTKSYPIIQLTSSLSSGAQAEIFWGAGDDDNEPTSYALARDIITMTGYKTTEVDTRARWARIYLSGTGELGYVFKSTPTAIKIVDDSGAIVSVSSNALQVVYNDLSGTMLGTTNDSHNTGTALYTSLTDASGKPLNKILDTLTVGVRDNCGQNLSSTGTTDTSSNALAVTMTDACGNAQASNTISGANTGHVALHYALADSCGAQLGTLKGNNGTNALYVHLTDSSGDSINTDNPLPISIGGDVTKGLTMDTSVNDTLRQFIDINVSDISGKSFNIDSLSLSNEAAVPVWFKLYDTHEGLVTYAEETNDYESIQATMKLNIAVPPLTSRDLTLQKGVLFNHGLAVRVSTEHAYDVSTSGNLGTNGQCFISTSHAQVGSTPEQITANVAARPKPENVTIRNFNIDRNGVTLKGYINTIREDDGVTTQKLLFVPLVATGIDGTHDAITISLNDLSGEPIPVTSEVSYDSFYNSPLLTGSPQLFTLQTPETLIGYTVIVNLNNGTDASYAHINVYDITSDPDAEFILQYDMPVCSFTRYTDDNVFTSYRIGIGGNYVNAIYNLGTDGGTTSDISQYDIFYAGLNNTLASLDGTTVDHSAFIIEPSSILESSSSTAITNTDLSAYLITYDASVYIINHNDREYSKNSPVGDPSSNRIDYFGISAGHIDGSNWCLSTPQFVGYVHNDNDTYRTSIARTLKSAHDITVSFYDSGVQLEPVTVSGVYDHDNGFKVSFYDSCIGNYSDIDRVTVQWDSNIYGFSLENLGGGTKFIKYN